MATPRRHVITAGAMGLTWLLTGCALISSRSGPDAVNAAIKKAPGVTDAQITFGPGGGLGEAPQGTISFDVPGDKLRGAFDEAWRRGIEVIHEMDQGSRDRRVTSVDGVASDGTTMRAYELLGAHHASDSWVGDYYDHYGLA